MIRKILLASLVSLTPVSAHAFEFVDGFEGPWVQTPGVYNPAFEGDGFDEDWFVSNVSWVGVEQFNMIAEEDFITEGEFAQKANAYWANGAPRDLYLARFVDGLKAGTTYKVTLDWRFDKGTGGDTDNHIFYDVRSGDQQSQDAIADIEIYGGHERPNTTGIYLSEGTIGDGAYHTLEREFTADGDSLTFMMIIRYSHLDESKGFAEPFDENWLFLDNFRVTDEATDVNDWTLY